MENKNSKVAFLVILLILLIAFFGIIRPFILPALFATLVAVICHPIYQMFLKILKGKRYVAALFSTVFAIMCVIVPLSVVVAVVITNLADVVSFITTQLQVGQVAENLDRLNIWISTQLTNYSSIIPQDFNLREVLLNVLAGISKIIYQYSPKFLTVTLSVVGALFLTVIFSFVFFAEGGRIYHNILSLLPLEEKHKTILASDVRGVITGTFLGMVATSIAQGILIGIGFWIVGISNPLVWGLVAIGITLVPVIGGPLVYIPASMAMFFNGQTGSGIFLLIYGVGVVSMVDNLIKPLIMRGKVNVHPILLAIGIVGGGIWLGPSGVIVGPLVVVLMMAMLKIYQREFL